MTERTFARDSQAARTLLYDAYARLARPGAWTRLRDAASDRCASDGGPGAALALPFWSQIAVAWSLPGAIAECAHQARMIAPRREAAPGDYGIVRLALRWIAFELIGREAALWRPAILAPVIAWEREAHRSQAQVLTLIERAIARADRELAQARGRMADDR